MHWKHPKNTDPTVVKPIHLLVDQVASVHLDFVIKTLWSSYLNIYPIVSIFYRSLISYIISVLKLLKYFSIKVILGSCYFLYVMPCVIWYHLYNFKNVKNIHGEVLL